MYSFEQFNGFARGGAIILAVIVFLIIGILELGKVYCNQDIVQRELSKSQRVHACRIYKP